MTSCVRWSTCVLFLCLGALAACGSDPASGSDPDASSLDADVGSDAGSGSIPDALADAGDDPTPDAGTDTTVEVGDDATVDTGADTAPDSGADTAPDTGGDVADDVPADATRICVPGTSECRDGAAATCAADGTRWNTTPCVGDTVCVADTCVPAICTPGTVLCAPGAVVTCNDVGDGFDTTPCPSEWACFEGACVECVRDTDCGAPDATICADGLCVPAPVMILTEALPAMMIATPTSATLEAAGGTTPYTWTTAAGTWPTGVSLSGAGLVTGTPTEVSSGEVTVRVTDAAADSDTVTLAWQVLPEGLRIVTDSLPTAEEGFEYDAQLEAIGGERPYGWMILDGALPAGITLSSDGHIGGTPSEVGDFTVTVRVFDRATPPGFADRELTLQVEIAPLRIVAETQYDLLITSVIVLPLMVPIEGIPVPYNQQLEARGGLRPYTWRETELAGALSFLIPNAGVPDGLTLAADGALTGSVTDTSQVIRVAIPFTAIELTGFFFTAEVSDTQEPADTASGIFLIPTVPIGG